LIDLTPCSLSRASPTTNLLVNTVRSSLSMYVVVYVCPFYLCISCMFVFLCARLCFEVYVCVLKCLSVF
jgi:hypothetical protein